jgi:lipopolysaccharide/colanic/teichoic acid biosynthesis glycosyltransferase
MDVWYVENRSMRLDLKILAMTVPRALRRSGVTQEGQATVEYFTGSES